MSNKKEPIEVFLSLPLGLYVVENETHLAQIQVEAATAHAHSLFNLIKTAARFKTDNLIEHNLRLLDIETNSQLGNALLAAGSQSFRPIKQAIYLGVTFDKITKSNK